MRSRSEEMRIATMISRRSRAIGWRLAMVSDGLFLELELKRIDLVVVGDHPSASCVSRLTSASMALAS